MRKRTASNVEHVLHKNRRIKKYTYEKKK